MNDFFNGFEKAEMKKYQHEPKIESTNVSGVIRVLEGVERDCYEPNFQHTMKMQNRKQVKSRKFYYQNGALMSEDGEICNFYIALMCSYIVEDENSEESLRFDVKFVVNRHGSNREHLLKGVRASDLKEAKLLKKVPFHVIYIELGKFKVIWAQYVNALIDEYIGEEVVLYMTAGWKKMGKGWYYVDGEKTLGLESRNAHALSKRYIRASVEPCHHYNNFEEMLLVVKGSPKMAVLLLYVFASFIYKIFEEVGYPLKFCVILVGPRGSRKTSLGLCFSQIENKTSPKFNFNATKAGIQASFKDYEDAVILIDDLAPSINPVRKRDNEEKLETLVRLFGDSGERVICTEFMQEGRRKPDYSVAGGCIITGEYYYSTGVESSIARTVVLELDDQDVQLDKLSFFQENPEILESMLHDFLVYISDHFSQVHSTIREQVGICRKESQGTFINGRFADYLGQFFAISEILGDFLAEVSNVDTTLLVEQLKKSAADILHRNNAKMKERTPINFIAKALFDFAESDKCVEWGDPVNDLEIYMIKTGTYYYVKESHLPNIVDTYAKQNAMMYLKMSSQEIAKILENAKVVTRIREGDTWRYSKKYPQYHRTRLMKLDFEMLKRAL